MKDGDSNGIVYFIRAGKDYLSPIKIGFTTFLEQRFSALQGANPEKLYLIGTIKGDEVKEAEIHNLLKQWNVRNEWFQGREVEIFICKTLNIKKPQELNFPERQRLLSLKKAAFYLDRGEDSLREMIYSGVFPVIQLGSRSKMWLDINDLDQWILDNKTFLRE